MAIRKIATRDVLTGLAIVALLAAFFNPPDWGVTSGEFEYVQRVVDGDTLLLGTGERMRLIGISTPETVHPQKPVEAFGKEATAFTKRMVEGKLVRLEFDPVSSRRTDGKDRYSRVPARRHAPQRGDHPARIWLRCEQESTPKVSARVSGVGARSARATAGAVGKSMIGCKRLLWQKFND